ncbi:MAG: DUF2085 domain-containing protein [Chloroflexi bacterium]|nr:MAG: DUF2085 domain-containing protein [Chloroflexota bacterium]
MEQNKLVTTSSRLISLPWLNIALSVFYLGLSAVLVFLPGGSVLDRLRWLDSGICAQLLTHSFYPGSERLPLCARNTGIYLGFVISLITLHLMGRGRSQQLPPWPIIVTLAVGVVALAVDGLNSLAVDLNLPHLYAPHNLIRLGTGLVTGLALAALALPILNQLFWHEYNEQRSISSWKMLLLFVPILAICFLVVASQSGIALYPLALLSTIGILTALSSVNLILIVAISRRNETFERYQQLLPFFSLALACTLGEMLALAQLKLVLFQALGI